MRQTFGKAERLHERKLIGQLFKNGKSFFVFPFKVYYAVREEEKSFPAQVLISVPKRNFKRATDRNRIKRLIREAYRKNKEVLCPSDTGQTCRKNYLIAFIYTHKQHMDYHEIEQKIILILHQLRKQNE